MNAIMHHQRVKMVNLFLESKTSELPLHFITQIQKLRDMFVSKLNITLFPLVGGSRTTQEQHLQIATIAEKLLLIRTAYNGTFEALAPTINDAINLAKHELAFPPGPDFERFEGKPCLVTTMMGISIKNPGDPFERVISHAKVQHLPRRRHQDSPIEQADMLARSSPSLPPATKRRRLGKSSREEHESQEWALAKSIDLT